MSLLALDEIHEWFHTHKFYAYSNAIAEFLNNIRWGIYTYLQPEFARSFTRTPGSSVAYSFAIPASIEGEFAKSCYWQLMNEVRSPPFVQRFSVREFFKSDRLDSY